MKALADLTASLARLSDAALLALQAAASGADGEPPGFVAWLEHAVEWEAYRRLGRHFPLHGPLATIRDHEIDLSFIAFALLAMSFRSDQTRDSDAVGQFLEASAATLLAQSERPSTQ
jgi:hypothetical protein